MQLLVPLRVLLARRPWLYWAVMTLIAGQLGVAYTGRLDALERARSSWTDTTVVWVATGDLGPGDPVRAERRTLPLAAVPLTAVVHEPPGGIVVQAVGTGEILTTADLGGDRLALLPTGWEAIAIETPGSLLALQPGDRVGVVDPTGPLVDEGIVIDIGDGTAIVAVPAAAAATVAIAAHQQSVALTLQRP